VDPPLHPILGNGMWMDCRKVIGGVLRNDNGLIKAKFSASVGIKDSNQAEFLDIVFALELSKNKVWLQHVDILILLSDEPCCVFVYYVAKAA
jgi:hypothetical protein